MNPSTRNHLRAALVLLGALTSRFGFVASAQGSPPATPANGDIAFVRGGNGSFQIFLRSPNGSQRQLTNFCATEDDPCPRAVGHLAFSPDGHKIAFDELPRGVTDASEIWVVDADGTNVWFTLNNAGSVLKR
jgi:Tol biopolymer transport system component